MLQFERLGVKFPLRGLHWKPPSFAFELWRDGGSNHPKAVAGRHRVKVRIANGYSLKGLPQRLKFCLFNNWVWPGELRIHAASLSFMNCFNLKTASTNSFKMAPKMSCHPFVS